VVVVVTTTAATAAIVEIVCASKFTIQANEFVTNKTSEIRKLDAILDKWT
jgi:hypothetical protein